MESHAAHTQRRVPPPLNTRALKSAQGIAQRGSVDDRVAATETKSRSRRPSFRRAISIISEPGHRQSDPSLTSPGLTSKPPRKSWANPRHSTSRHSYSPSARAPTAPVQYYQDPETRLRLKEYFGSPEKFDAALANGFAAAPPPSAHDSISADREIHPSYATSNDATRFLRSNVISWLDLDDHDDEDDDESDRRSERATSEADRDLGEFDIDDYLDDAERSSLEVTSPITPRTVDLGSLVRPMSARGTPHPLPSATLPTSPYRTSNPSMDWPRPTQSFDRPSSYTTPASPSSVNFATLRMTLTRPELRAPDEKIYGSTASPYASHGRFPQRIGSDPWDLPPLEEAAEPGEERRTQRTRSRSLWKKMSLSGIKKQG